VALAAVLAIPITGGCRGRGNEENAAVETKTEAPRAESQSASSPVTGVAPKAYGGFPSVVMLEPVEPETDAGSEPDLELEPALMDQYGNAFHPEILVVRPGQTVEFRNSEDVAHNVHVIDQHTRETIFNVATPVVGSYEYSFEEAGAFDVSCNMHSWMAAFIIVTDAPYVAIADKDGEFSLPAVPAGNYTVRVWNVEETRRVERRVQLAGDGSPLSLIE
jgi:plastocyanin